MLSINNEQEKLDSGHGMVIIGLQSKKDAEEAVE
jgi:hypothetical protein